MDPEPDLKPVCERIIPYNNETAVIPGYEGIPQNLLVNFVSWLVLLILFSILRKKAWDYGRMALTRPKRNRWTSLFYSEVRKQSIISDSHESIDLAAADRDRGFLSWLRLCFTLTNADLQRKCGIDAVYYLRFQMYMIVYTAITMFFCLVVILPTNITGTLKSPDLQSFGVTTISNLSGDSPTLWIHIVLGIGFFLLAFALMQHFARRFWSEAPLMKKVSHRTLMISGIRRAYCQRELLMQHFNDAYPECEIDDIQVCFDIKRLVDLDNKLETAKSALAYSERRLSHKGYRPIMIPRCCGWFWTNCYRKGRCLCCFRADGVESNVTSDGEVEFNHGRPPCCCGCPGCCPVPVDAINYYKHEADSIVEQIQIEGAVAVNRKIGTAFVTFSTRESAALVHKSFHTYFQLPPTSSLASKLGTTFWVVEFAPVPGNIIWTNLGDSHILWWIRAFVINLVVFLVVFFMTTPTYVLNLIHRMAEDKLPQTVNPLVNQFLPSIILWSVSALLPWIVSYSDQWVGHRTRSSLHLTVMVKTFTLLILMVLILPSLGLTSIPALIQWLFPEMRYIPIYPPENPPVVPNSSVTVPMSPIGKQSFQWECVFMPDNGAFFVNYVITSALIGTGLQLTRIPELIYYFCRMICVRSQAEKATARKHSQWEFDFGRNYAWILCVFAVVSAYSILCPLITPFGLFYLVLRMLVDRYNIYFAYLPSRIDSRVHWLAINFLLATVLMLQINLFMFVIIRQGALANWLSIISLAGVVVCSFMWLGNTISGWIFVGSTSTKRRPPQPDNMLDERSTAATTLRFERNSYSTGRDEQSETEATLPRTPQIGPQGDVVEEPVDTWNVAYARTYSIPTPSVSPMQPDDGWLQMTTGSLPLESASHSDRVPSYVMNMIESSRNPPASDDSDYD